MDTLQITLTLLHPTGRSRGSHGGERGAARGEEKEMGEWANETVDGQGKWRRETEQKECEDMRGDSA